MFHPPKYRQRVLSCGTVLRRVQLRLHCSQAKRGPLKADICLASHVSKPLKIIQSTAPSTVVAEFSNELPPDDFEMRWRTSRRPYALPRASQASSSRGEAQWLSCQPL